MMPLWQLPNLLVAQAEQAPAGPLASIAPLVPFLLMLVAFYFIMIRPASRQRKEHKDLLDALKKDDEIVTSAGFWGRIISIDEKIATLEIADKVKIKILRDRIAGRWNPAPAESK